MVVLHRATITPAKAEPVPEGRRPGQGDRRTP